ncbi:ROK family protein [Microbacterium sp. H1-D42]|uniref:ROK family protein n=1 Tax=Microbacterium sp. H1-D42 TaxID=2925844 RepID=UPI001F52E946|nr:ROK family protein [Microbacterium sp. H1-D42]UNK69469.1 ROK family protein [Microbacterium sp. H1-D42]
MPADVDPVFVGIDIGGTKIAVLVCDDQRRIHQRGEVPAPAAEGGAAMADAAASLVRTLVGGRSIRAAGVGAAGVIDHDTGTIRAASSTFTDWVGFPLAEELSQRLECPVVVENDVNAFLLGESDVGETDVLGVMLGTGVGGALLIDGGLRRGPHGAAGEIGHTPGYSDLLCTCGQVGHLETLASGTSIALRYAERTGQAADGARDVAARADAGDTDARAVFRDAGHALGLACASAATLLDISHAIVGGGVAHVWHLLQPGIDDALGTDAPITGIPLHIRPATRGADAVALGAIESARSLALASVF